MSSGREGALERTVYVAGAYRPFGDLTAQDARAQAEELRSVGGVGPTAKAVPVARAWGELARLMDETSAATVRDFDAETAGKCAERVWVTRSLL